MGGGWGWNPEKLMVQSLSTHPRLSFRLTIRLLPNRPKPMAIQALLTFTPALPDPGSTRSRPVGTEVAAGDRSRQQTS